MISRLPILAALALSVPAAAAERVVGVGSFTRLRVQGGFDVRVAPGSPRVTISGDREAIEAVDAHVENDALVLRRTVSGSWSERPVDARRTPVAVTITTPSLTNVALIGGARVAVARMAGPRVDLAVTGTGSVAVAASQADQVDVRIVGSGTVAIAGRAATARLSTNGPGTIDAASLDAGDVVVRLDGLGTTSARARFTAAITNTGLGSVTVAGNARCTVRADAGGPVECGRR